MTEQKDSKLGRSRQESLKHYSIPEGYFSDLSGRIMERIGTLYQEESRKSTLMLRFRPYLTVAASLFLLFSLYFVISPIYNDGRESDPPERVSPIESASPLASNTLPKTDWELYLSNRAADEEEEFWLETVYTP